MGVIATPARTSDRDILITRMFDAPRELVFDAWTDPPSSRGGTLRTAARSGSARSM